jgi:hypothetical protein
MFNTVMLLSNPFLLLCGVVLMSHTFQDVHPSIKSNLDNVDFFGYLISVGVVLLLGSSACSVIYGVDTVW